MKQDAEGQRIWDTERKIKTSVLYVLYLKFLKKKVKWRCQADNWLFNLELKINGKGWKLKFLSLQYTGGF